MWSALNSAITKMLIYKKISLKASQKVKNMHNKCFFDPTGSELGSKYLVTRYKYRHQLQHIYSKKNNSKCIISMQKLRVWNDMGCTVTIRYSGGVVPFYHKYVYDIMKMLSISTLWQLMRLCFLLAFYFFYQINIIFCLHHSLRYCWLKCGHSYLK